MIRWSLGRLQVGDHALVVRAGPQFGDLAGDRPVPALGAAPLELGLPELADRRVGAAHLLVGLGPLLALELADLGLELAAPHRLRVVEALVGPAVAALAALEDVRPVRAGDVGAEDVHDLGLQPEPVPVVDQPLQDPGRHDAAAADHHRARAQRELLVDVLVRLVGVDHLGRIPVVLAVALQVGQQLQARITDRDVHVRAAVGQPPGRRGARRRRQDGEVAALRGGAGPSAPGPCGRTARSRSGRTPAPSTRRPGRPSGCSSPTRIGSVSTFHSGAKNPLIDLAPNASRTA